jgi:ATP-dependent DNA helicase PIF1
MSKSTNKDLDLSNEQAQALELLRSGENVFISGGAGSGKSYLIRAFRNEIDPKAMPILASTGAAAVLIGGRTFHSFFGLGIMEGGPLATLERARKDPRVMKRVAQVDGVIIDEISMIPSDAFETAELIARAARGSGLPWGGMSIVTVGDFAQLPPVSKSTIRPWAFRSKVWEETQFQSVVLSQNQRVSDDDFISILQDVRAGNVSQRVANFLDSRQREDDQDDKAIRLFPRRDQSEFFNQKELAEIRGQDVFVDTIYIGEEKFVESLKRSSPVPERLHLKAGCRVMFIQNDPQKRWVNGTRGTIVDFEADKIKIAKDGGREVTAEKTTFSLQNAEGKIVASLINFPIILAYATTIHKSQGATLDELWVDLSRLWEPGHAYVALSRLKTADGLRLLGWSKSSFKVDPEVVKFYQKINTFKFKENAHGG